MKLYDTEAEAERAFLVGIRDEKTSEAETASLLRELASLAGTLGIREAGSMTAPLRNKTAAFLLGSGKVDEIIAAAKASGASSIIIDRAMSPLQQRNWEELSGLAVYDRSELIIDIFASRAMTREAALQVELARLNYMMPRLAHSYSGLNRQRGGRYGTKGSGEQKIELDRRQIAKKISDIETELEAVKKSRGVQKKLREKSAAKRAALVGYTNAGKSSLLNALCAKGNALAEDKLFATLDPQARRLDTKSGSVILSDTVGFVRNLPHGLIKAFKATLDEAAEADILIHVIDVSDAEYELRRESVMSVLSEIGAAALPTVIAYNKTDKAPGIPVPPDGIGVSAHSGQGLPELSAAIETELTKHEREMRLCVPHAEYALVPLLYRQALVLSESHDETGCHIVCRVPDRLVSTVARFMETPL